MNTVCVDWGTSNLRAYLLSPCGTKIEGIDLPLGVKRLGDRDCREILEEITTHWRNEHAVQNVLMAGMVGSEIGWTEVALLNGQCGVEEFSNNLREVAFIDGLNAWIVPGGRTQNGANPSGMMRGEETQVLGLIELIDTEDRRICLPGSHSKWVSLVNRKISDIKTYMTGEMYQVMRDNTVLQECFKGSNGALDKGAFKDGLIMAASGMLISRLMFSIRTEFASQVNSTANQRASKLSGILIGSEIMDALSDKGQADRAPVILVANGAIKQAYMLAFSHMGIPLECVDSETAFLRGCRNIMISRDRQSGASGSVVTPEEIHGSR